MGMYYNLFALGKQLDPVVSVPYVDAFGTGRLYRSYFIFPSFKKSKELKTQKENSSSHIYS